MKAAKRIQRLASTSGPEGRVLVTCIGSRLTTKSGHSFEHPEMPTMLVHTVGIGWAAPTKEEEAACKALWLSSNTAPAAYLFPSTRLPTIEDGCGYDKNPNPATPADTEETD